MRDSFIGGKSKKIIPSMAKTVKKTMVRIGADFSLMF
jgi:hypothetical protein